MKKFIAAASSLALALSISVAVPAPAQAESNGGIVNLCKTLVDLGYYENLGSCASSASQICRQAKDAGLFPYTFPDGTVLRNQGDCVNYVKGSV